MQPSILRSYLFVSANRIERVAKAQAAGPHAVIVDLEDAVPLSEKTSARESAARGLPGAGPVFVRINGPETEWFQEDLELCRSLEVRGVVVPKAEQPEHMRHVSSNLKADTILLPLIETALGSDRFKDEIESALKCAVRPPKMGRPPKSRTTTPHVEQRRAYYRTESSH